MPNGIWCRFALQEGLLDRLKHSSMKNRTFVDMRAVADAVSGNNASENGVAPVHP